jgi:hypothetical protein
VSFWNALKLPSVFVVVVGTVWCAGWERDLSSRISRGYVLPPPVPQAREVQVVQPRPQFDPTPGDNGIGE